MGRLSINRSVAIFHQGSIDEWEAKFGVVLTWREI